MRRLRSLRARRWRPIFRRAWVASADQSFANAFNPADLAASAASPNLGRRFRSGDRRTQVRRHRMGVRLPRRWMGGGSCVWSEGSALERSFERARPSVANRLPCERGILRSSAVLRDLWFRARVAFLSSTTRSISIGSSTTPRSLLSAQDYPAGATVRVQHSVLRSLGACVERRNAPRDTCKRGSIAGLHALVANARGQDAQ